MTQLGILLDDELKDWFVNKCRTTRSTDASKRLLSAATVIAAYLEHFRKIDNINPWGIVPQLKDDSVENVVEIIEPVPESVGEESKNPQTNLAEEVERLRLSIDTLKTPTSDNALNKLIEEKIIEVLTRLKPDQLPNIIPNYNTNTDSNNNKQNITLEQELDTILTPEEKVVQDPETSPVADIKALAEETSEKEDVAEDKFNAPVTSPETATPPVVLPEAVEGEDLDEDPTPTEILQKAIEHWETSNDAFSAIATRFKIDFDKKIIIEAIGKEKYQEILEAKQLKATHHWRNTTDGLETAAAKFGIPLKKEIIVAQLEKIVGEGQGEAEYEKIKSTKSPGPGKKS